MDPSTAARILRVDASADWTAIQRSYRRALVDHHPDHTGSDDATELMKVMEAFRTLERARAAGHEPTPAEEPVRSSGRGTPGHSDPLESAEGTRVVTGVPIRLGSETIAVGAPPDETFRLLLDAAHDVGEITYLDRSMPIVEILCRFVDEPATSLVLTVQGRNDHTEVMCTVESIEARPAPPAELVVDLLEDAVRRRLIDWT